MRRQPLPDAGANTATQYKYDASGAITERTSGDGSSQRFSYNDFGRVDGIDVVGGANPGSVSYDYDADGNQVFRRDPGKTTLYLGVEDLTYTTSTKTLVGTRYYSQGGTVVVERVGNKSPQYVLSDPHGTASTLVDTAPIAGGTPGTSSFAATRRHFDPYGSPLKDADGAQSGAAQAWIDERAFLHQPGSTSTGLRDLGARLYDPELGRFVSADPVLDVSDPQSLNAYAYADNDPVNGADPDGRHLCQSGSTGGECDGYLPGPGGTPGKPGKHVVSPYGSGSGSGSGSGGGGGSNGSLPVGTGGGGNDDGGSGTGSGSSGGNGPKISDDQLKEIKEKIQKTLSTCAELYFTYSRCLEINIPSDIHNVLHKPDLGDLANVVFEGVGMLEMGAGDIVGLALQTFLGRGTKVSPSNGPGIWGTTKDIGGRGAKYAKQVTGSDVAGYYLPNVLNPDRDAVEFDGYAAGFLLEAKGPQYGGFANDDGTWKSWYHGIDSDVAQARRQVAAARGGPVLWVVGDKNAANAYTKTFEGAGVTGVQVIYSAPHPINKDLDNIGH